MLTLIFKDIRLQKKLFVFIQLLITVYLIVFTVLDINQISMFAVLYMSLYSFVNRMLYEEEKTYSMRMLAAMPLKRDTIVMARYAASLVFLVIPAIASGLIMGLLKLLDIQPPNISVGNSMETLVVCMCVLTVLISIQLPIYYRFGYKRAATVFSVVFMAIAMIIFVSVFKSGNADDLMNQSFQKGIDTINIWTAVISAAAVFLGSAAVSVRLLAGKELY